MASMKNDLDGFGNNSTMDEVAKQSNLCLVGFDQPEQQLARIWTN